VSQKHVHCGSNTRLGDDELAVDARDNVAVDASFGDGAFDAGARMGRVSGWVAVEKSKPRTRHH
jgi:hypothetical protein